MKFKRKKNRNGREWNWKPYWELVFYNINENIYTIYKPTHRVHTLKERNFLLHRSLFLDLLRKFMQSKVRGHCSSLRKYSDTLAIKNIQNILL